MIEKGTTMDYFRRTALIACICISVWCCIVNGQESQPHDWRYPQQVHEFGSFKIAFGDISAELGRGALVLMEARPGIIGVVIVYDKDKSQRRHFGVFLQTKQGTRLRLFKSEDYSELSMRANEIAGIVHAKVEHG